VHKKVTLSGGGRCVTHLQKKFEMWQCEGEGEHTGVYMHTHN
jgi:hypothetical protein